MFCRAFGLLKDNAGLDLNGLLVGSEGTLAVVTQARLKLITVRRRRVAALFGVGSMAKALRVLERLRATAPSLEAIDYFEQSGMRHVCARLHVRPPFGRTSLYSIAECAGDSDPTHELGSVADLVEASAVSGEESGRRALWRYRDALNEILRSLGTPLKLDVAVPVSSQALFAEELNKLIAVLASRAELVLFGHLGDANAHVNVIGADDHFDELEEGVLRLATRLGVQSVLSTVSAWPNYRDAQPGPGARRVAIARASEGKYDAVPWAAIRNDREKELRCRTRRSTGGATSRARF